MSSYRTQQHRLVHRGQAFHLVSYAGQPADETRHRAEVPPSWYLMLSGKRWMVCPEVAEATPDELDRGFRGWLDVHVFGDAAQEWTQPPAEDALPPAGPPEDGAASLPPEGLAPQ